MSIIRTKTHAGWDARVYKYPYIYIGVEKARKEKEIDYIVKVD